MVQNSEYSAANIAAVGKISRVMLCATGKFLLDDDLN
jgi:hypothetical protein